ncbi:hypothetical protein SUDANB106_02518 [Streptomyces sp. enrichment culture]|uniref:ATP-binding protein n=1 Tax=Streptomyces sp. enrichment culture TaxID=1795815 RepID=UPI003F553C10
MHSSSSTPKYTVSTVALLSSLRDSGHSISSAVSEVIDNSLEARANNIQVFVEESTSGRKKNVARIAFIDDGAGMSAEFIQRHLQLGFSSRNGSGNSIGKFGVGSKLAALSVGTRIDVWSRTNATEPINHVFLDLDQISDDEGLGAPATIPRPDHEPIPPQYTEEFPEVSGTLVVWSKIDRASDKQGRRSPDHIRVELNKEISRIFREYICGGINICIDGVPLLAHDPTFLREGTWADHILAQDLSKEGADSQSTRRHFPGSVLLDETLTVPGTSGQIRVILTLAPVEVRATRGAGASPLAKKLRLPENEGAISFMRLDREISYTIVPRLFPGGVQSLDRYIGFEVHFGPELDKWMGIRNVKRGAEPMEELRSVLREVAARVIPHARNQIHELWDEKARKGRVTLEGRDSIARAVGLIDRTMPKGRGSDVTSQKELLEKLKEIAEDAGHGSSDQDKATYLEEIQGLPFIVETSNWPGGQLIDITHLNDQTLLRFNTRHSFYREVYEPLQKLVEDSEVSSAEKTSETARRALEAITLLFVAYAKAESMHEDPTKQYGDLRQWWGQFTERYLQKIKNVL